jgi:tRNA uridine 5-carboxymethylaminomethyl modification enzyme
MFKQYDVIVVGAGHAGNEAAAAAANMGSSVLLVTMNMTTIGQMSCNPAMGGVAKGQIVREIDALGGLSGIVTDKTTIQFRMLNRSKGPAMWSPRSQNDRAAFAEEWRYQLESTPNLDFWQDMVTGLIVKNDQVIGIKTGLGNDIYGKTVVLTNGTFLNGLIHIGEKQFGGGRAAEKAASGITEQLVELGFEAGRMKTGTPPRIDGRSLNYALMEEQPGDENPQKFSYQDSTTAVKDQLSCWITYTNDAVHQVLKTGFEQSPMFTGRIKGLGPRYCPSVEDKINRFADKDRHQIFVEPEGRRTVEIYVNGFSTSLPEEVQQKAIRLIPGFENAKMFRPGYAIEYDFFPPTQLKHTLETKLIRGLFLAGQINGTTGYEEAGGQGIMAGINAHLQAHDKGPFTLGRDQAYIGVLIDDLITKGTDEPYRMFTSRAEFRTLLRQDNADIRLTGLSHAIGLASETAFAKVEAKIAATAQLIKDLGKWKITPDQANPVLEGIGTAQIREKTTMLNLIRRPDVDMDSIEQMALAFGIITEPLATEVSEQASIQIKYEDYLEKERVMADKLSNLENIKINPTFDYAKISSISNEAREKLSKAKPVSLAQASRISGIKPSDISILLLHIQS